MRRTKIVATIGPATRDPEKLHALIAAGVDVVRLNFAHDTIEHHAKVARDAREAAADQNRIIGVLADLPGPKMRTGPFKGGQAELVTGDHFTLVPGEVEGDSEQGSTSVDNLAELVDEEDEIYLADGEVVLKVTDIDGDKVETEIVRGGVVRSRKGMHLPKAELKMQAFTTEDEKALHAAIEMQVDLVGLSFIRDANDLERARAAIPPGAVTPLLVAKIETASAVDNLDSIVPASDAVMVARGDLGIQTPLPNVPLLQKKIIRACNQAGKPVITATEMLESMTEETLPTRAEVTDVANAVFDGTDAVMLSEETAVGKHPVEAVKIMSEIVVAAEQRKPRRPLQDEIRGAADPDRVAWAVAHAAVEAAEDVGATAILSVTRTGSTPRRVSAYRPSMPVGGVSGYMDCLGALALCWGVQPLRVDQREAARGISEEIERAISVARAAEFVKEGDLVVVVAGGPDPRAGATDFMRVARA